MKRSDSIKFEGEDLKRAFSPVPPAFERSIEFAFQRGAERARPRRSWTVAMSAAAVLVVMLAVAALAAGNLKGPRPDNMVLFQGGGNQASHTAAPTLAVTEIPWATSTPTPTPEVTPTPRSTPAPTQAVTAAPTLEVTQTPWHPAVPRIEVNTAAMVESANVQRDEAADVVEVILDGAAYEALIACRGEDYLQLSVAGFNGALISAYGDPAALLADYEQVMSTLTEDDANYDYFARTLNLSVNEICCENEVPETAFFGSAIWMPEGTDSRPAIYADYVLHYAIADDRALTVAGREGALMAFQTAFEEHVTELGEHLLDDDEIEAELPAWAEKTAADLSTKEMELSCENVGIEIFEMLNGENVIENESAPEYAVAVDASEGGEGDSLRQLLTDLILKCGEVTDARARDRMVESAEGVLAAIRDGLGMDVEAWEAPVWACLLEEMGLSETFIVESDAVNRVVEAMLETENGRLNMLWSFPVERDASAEGLRAEEP